MIAGLGEQVVLAVDLGGSSMKGAIVSEHGVTVATETRLTPESDIVETLVGLLHSLEAVASAQGLRVIAAGVVTPGIVNEQSGVVQYASNLGWRDMPLLDLLKARLDMPVAIGHDVRAAGLAEQLLGAARGAEDFVLIPIGTGVAAALIASSDTLTGATGAAGEFGHIPVVPGGELCLCGQRGCLEVYVSGAGLARRYLARSGTALSSQQIVARLGSDTIADDVWQEAVQVLGQGLAIMTLLLDPRVIVIGGGFAQAGEALFGPVRAALSAGLAWRDAPPVVMAHLGSDAGRIGASILALRAAGRGDVVEGWPVVAAA
jgi:glucokinase